MSASELHRAQHFSFVLDLFGLLGLLLPLVVLAFYAKWGHRFMGESAAGPIGTGMLLAMLGLAILAIATLPAISVSSGGCAATGSRRPVTYRWSSAPGSGSGRSSSASA